MVKLIRGSGAAQLIWQNGEEQLHRSVHVCIPIAWFDNPSQHEYVEAAARSVALGILAETKALG